MSRDELDTLFKQYESAFDKLDAEAISGFCADSFMSASPKGIISQTKQEYVEKAKRAADFYRSVGRKSAKIVSKRIMPICDQYSIAVIRWGITFEQTGSSLMEIDISYIIYENGSEPKIVLFISHEDEEARLRKFGIRPR